MLRIFHPHKSWTSLGYIAASPLDLATPQKYKAPKFIEQSKNLKTNQNFNLHLKFDSVHCSGFIFMVNIAVLTIQLL